MARTQIFLVQCGIEPSSIRFRQQMDNEKAHYATDCWVTEVLTCKVSLRYLYWISDLLFQSDTASGQFYEN